MMDSLESGGFRFQSEISVIIYLVIALRRYIGSP